MSRRIVFVELNEVPWRVLDDWIADHPSSAIGRLLAQSRQYTSVAVDEGHLSPWVTWPTVHRGVPDTEHHIGHFGQDLSAIDRTAPPYWVLARRAGHRVGVFGPLHTHPLPDDVERYEFWLPDTFASDPAAHPSALEAFQTFNLAMARASARNVDTAIDWRSALRFVARAPFAGLRPATVAEIVRQLVGERRHPWTRVRRRSLQSVLAFDLFVAQLRSARPSLAVVFTNHVASAMHRYWAARYPDDYDAGDYGFDDEWRTRYAGEIDVAMGHADRFVGRLADFVRRDDRYLLVVASSMGQGAAQGTPVRELLLLRDLDAFMAAAGIASHERRPAMDPMVSVRIDPDERDTFDAFLQRLRIGGQPIGHEADGGGFVSLEFGQADDAIGTVTIDGREVEPAELGLARVVIEDEAGSSAYHVPEGSLFVFDPRRPGAADHSRPEIPTTAIAPAVLDALGVPPVAQHRPVDGFRLDPVVPHALGVR